MAKQKSIFPDLPRTNQIADANGVMNDAWRLYFQQVTVAMQSVLSPEGFQLPDQTADDIALLTGDQSKNRILINDTDDTALVNLGGVWKTIQTS